ncbi:MAG: hypothetical protein KF729_01320 [Sandaracinaceae bacterium]|nr:hypothetical protein [Sandaracinaceae bacterium]
MNARCCPSFVLVSLLALAGCDSDPATDAGAGGDGGLDASTDGGTDAGIDAGFDAGFDAGYELAPVFRNPVDLPDDELASAALRLMGAPEAGGSGSCSDCHAITRPNIRHFWDLTERAWRTCFADLDLVTTEAAQAALACLRAADRYTPRNAGVFATGAGLPWFPFAFRRAHGASWETEYETFRALVQQPPDDHPALTQEEFDLLTEWFLRGTPLVETILPSLDGPGECTPYVDASVIALVAEGARSGWSARNREAALLMHGCAGAADPSGCLADSPRVTDFAFGARWETPGTTMRLLFQVPYRTSYWTKSSADGRFVAHGGNDTRAGASIIDLARGVVMAAEARYDPGWFPDNSGFMFQGTSRGPAVCEQSVLTAASPTRITFREAGCSRAAELGLYQHVGASLDGGDYWVVDSLWSGDTGHELTDPPVMSEPGASLRLHRLVNTGTGFDAAGVFSLSVPWQANAVVSPTMRLVATQLADADGDPLGFVLHRIDVARAGSGDVTDVELVEVGRYCTPGGKAAFSLDDRWLVTHHRVTDADAVDLGFTGPSDPGFAPYLGVSNVYLIDIATGARTRVTNMQPGQLALFPHFRSDGWLYFLVRDGAPPEHIVATDAALVLAR